MAVDNPNVIDIIGTPADGAFVALTISDHLDWLDPPEHLLTLQEKLNRYFAFVEAGELLERHPAARGKRVRIDVVFKYAPPPEAEDFLFKARVVAQQGAFELTWRLGPGAAN
jgi:hypothetical protein